MISLKIRLGAGKVITLPEAPPELHLDDIAMALTRFVDLDSDCGHLQGMQEAMDVPDEWRDHHWSTQLAWLRYTLQRQGAPDIQPGDHVEMWHDHKLVVTHWLVAFAGADTDCVWASLPNDNYRMEMV